MVTSTKGEIPKSGFLEKRLKAILNSADKKAKKILVPYLVKEYKPLIDSSNISLHDWNSY